MRDEKFLTEGVIFLSHRVASISSEKFSAHLKEEGITLWEWRILAALLEAGDRRLGDLSESIRIELSSLSRTVAAMERKRLIARRYRDGEDGRALSINLTAKGSRLAESLVPLFELYRETYLKGISARDQEVVRGVLKAIYSNIVNSSLPTSHRTRRPTTRSRNRKPRST